MIWLQRAVYLLSGSYVTGLTFRRGRFSLRGRQHSRSFYTHPSTPPLLASCSWQKTRWWGGGGGGRRVMGDRRCERVLKGRLRASEEWVCWQIDKELNTKHSLLRWTVSSPYMAEFYWLEQEHVNISLSFQSLTFISQHHVNRQTEQSPRHFP